ncbi:Abi family protein [Boudabousia marimammalium]|nr:Abi family protein [Boudabousia marimammalium]
MTIPDLAAAEAFLCRVNYYRLSGYWHPMRRFDSERRVVLDSFQDGASFGIVTELYDFDEKLRNAIFSSLAPVEMAIRTMLGHELGRINPTIHLCPDLLGAQATQRSGEEGNTRYDLWIQKYRTQIRRSKEDFVSHHNEKYDGKLPIWAAVEVMDWGMLSHLYAMSPNITQNRIANSCGLSSPQLQSWLKSLNILRNYSAHHARVFNRVYDIKPKLNRKDDPNPNVLLTTFEDAKNRVFGQLSMIQYLHLKLELSPAVQLPALLATYPDNRFVPFSRLGAPSNWQTTPLWQSASSSQNGSF